MLKIDIHNHIYPENYWKALLKISEHVTFPIDARRILSYYSQKGILVKPEETIVPMEKLGISLNAPALRCALEIVGPEHLVFGTDHPFWPLETVSLLGKSLDGLGLSARDKEAINGKNLLKILHNPN